MMQTPTILIVGAGPVGLTTALSLHRSGVPPRDILVADQRPARDLTTWSKAISMSASSLEVFRILGIAERFIEVGRPLYTNHFGCGLRLLDLNYDVIGTKYPFNMGIPQLRTEAILLQRCEEVGIRFSWGRRFTTFSQNDSGVSATFQKSDLAGNAADDHVEFIEASRLVGCDSTHSAVREAAGIPFEGTTTTRYTWLADGYCDVGTPGMLTVRDKEGKSLVIASGDGPTGRRFIGNTPLVNTTPGEDPTAPSEDEGMNTGLVDATNLAWKLAAVVTGQVGPGQRVIERVLDSYTTERRALAEAVNQNSRMQMQVLFEYTEDEKAVSAFINEALGEPSLNKRWAQRFTGFTDPVEPYQLSFDGRTSDSLVGTRITHIADDNDHALLEATPKDIFVLAAVGGSDFEADDFGKFKGVVKTSKHEGLVHVHEAPVRGLAEKWKQREDDGDTDVSQADLAKVLQWWFG
ncbi:pentachlorophenol 4 [Diaporthe eres]|nr:pentachlorophenol 4 [Diaporthe eres]